jgi:hydroxymethylglutaryl-CoA lyase
MKLIECPRDAMQGLHDFIPTEKKAAYINALLKVGFDTIDFGSFVSPKAIPQMRDTAEVLAKLDLDSSRSDLLAIVANTRGGNDAAQFDEIRYLGFPFSVSETFQQRNTNKSIDDSLHTVEALMTICETQKKELVVYLSMAFGNPYGDPWSVEVVAGWAERLAGMGVKIQALSDTIGVSAPDNIESLFGGLIPAFPEVEFGAHLHTTPDSWKEKIVAAYDSGCRRFDSAVKGYGGCPMAKDDLVGNMPTEKLISFLSERKIDNELNGLRFETAYNKALETFPL